MKKLYKVLSIIAIPSILLLYSYSTGSPGGKTGSVGDDGANCTECHNDFDPEEISGWISTDISFQGFLGGETYNITVTGFYEDVVKMGFELTVEDESGEKLGGFAITDAERTQFTNNDNAVTHTAEGNAPTGNSNSWTVEWTAPEAIEGSVIFNAAVNAANGNGNTSGDHIFLTSTTTFQNTTGVGDDLLAGKVNVYPNPVSDYVTVSAPENSSLQIVDMQGRLIEEILSATGKERIDMTSFTKGLYFVRISHEGSFASKQILVN